MKKHGLRINTTTGLVTDLSGGNIPELSVVNGDTVLFVVEFVEQFGVTEPAVIDLTQPDGAPMALRCTVKNARTASATLLTFQDVFNDGNFVSYEDLTIGRVTWLVDFNQANIDAELGGTSSTSVYIEFSMLTAAGIPQTLAQIPLLIFEQLDDGAVGTPPPSEPTYMTAAAAAAAFVPKTSYVGPRTISASGPITAIDGIEIIYVDTSAANITIDLPAIATWGRWIPTFIKIAAANDLALNPNGAEEINDLGAGADITVSGAFASLACVQDGTRIIIPTEATP